MGGGQFLVLKERSYNWSKKVGKSTFVESIDDEEEVNEERKHKRGKARLAMQTQVLAVDCIGHSGGIIVLWKNSQVYSVLSYSHHHIDVLIHNPMCEWRVMGFYGYPNRAERILPWNLLCMLRNRSNAPWQVIGNFNDLLYERDKRGAVAHPSHLFRGFREAIVDCNLSDVDLIGHQFTWFRGRGRSSLVEERLDRAMGTFSWHECFPRTMLINLVAPVLNHNLILLCTDSLPFRQCFRRFQIENKWLLEEEVPTIVMRSWGGFADLDILSRLNVTSNTLFLWGRHLDTALVENKKEIEQEIDRLQFFTDPISCNRFMELRRKLAACW
ncbi:hypothetical protein ACS0TY_031161 [Phlomoides rotata]